MILPLLFVPLVYGMSSTPNACAEPADRGYTNSQTCGAPTTDPRTPSLTQKTCCWKERVPGNLPPLNEVTYCQTCQVSTNDVTFSCKPKVQQLQAPTQLPPGFLENPPIQEQTPSTPAPPPLFGENTNVPPTTGGIEQPLTPQTTTPGVPTEGGSTEQPPTPQTVAPQDDQQDDNQGGGVLPNIQNRPNIVPDSEITRQPEDEGQEDSSEGAETAGPLT